MSKRSFFVVGPESTGTRMLMRALILSGAYEDNDKWDVGNSPDFMDITADTIAVHRSLPHGQNWPDLQDLLVAIRKGGYEVIPLMMTRDINATMKSQVKRDYVINERHALLRINTAYEIIMRNLHKVTPVSYEAFCFNENFRKWLFVEHLNMPETPIQIWEGNSQYYKLEDNQE